MTVWRNPSAQEEGIDLMRLYASDWHRIWGRKLMQFYRDTDLRAIGRTSKQLKIGMAKLTDQKLNTDEMIGFYESLLRSLERTGQRICLKLWPHNPNDAESIKAKKRHDREYNKMLRDWSY